MTELIGLMRDICWTDQCRRCKSLGHLIYCHARTIDEALTSGASCCNQHDGLIVVGCNVHTKCFVCADPSTPINIRLQWTRLGSFDTVVPDMNALDVADDQWRDRLADAERSVLYNFTGANRSLPSLSDVARGRAERLWDNDPDRWGATAGSAENLAEFIEQETKSRREPWILAIRNVVQELESGLAGRAFISALIHFSHRFNYNLVLEWPAPSPTKTIFYNKLNDFGIESVQ